MPRSPEPTSHGLTSPGPTSPGPTSPGPGEELVRVRDLSVHYGLSGSSLGRLFGSGSGVVKAVDGVNLTLRRGEVLGLVGESGSGKTTMGRAVLGLTAPTGGQVRYAGRDLAELRGRELRALRRRAQMVFQDPHAALNPSMDIETAVGHPLRIHKVATDREQRRARVVDALEQVGLSPVERFLTKFPSDLSGGQKQRAVLARAIILGPELLVADEPVSMLDMSVRAKILQLMLDLKDELGLTYVYITHDLATAKYFCDRVAICYLGRVVEIGETARIFAEPKHPYTKALLGAVPEPDPRQSAPRDLPRGEIPDAAAPPLGCSYHPRCPYAFDACGWESRDLRALLEEHWLALDEQEYAGERARIANLEDLDRPDHRAHLAPGAGFAGTDVEAILERVRAADPEEPLWRGVRGIDRDDGGVAVDFCEGEDPGLRRAGEVEVACHLYPPPD